MYPKLKLQIQRKIFLHDKFDPTVFVLHGLKTKIILNSSQGSQNEIGEKVFCNVTNLHTTVLENKTERQIFQSGILL